MNKGFFWRGFITGTIVFIFLAVFAYNKFIVQPDIPLNKIEVQNLNGTKVELTNYIGKPLVVNYWATWCAPCLKEFPIFNSIIQEFGDDVNFVMISDESIEKINKFSTSNPYLFKYLKSIKAFSEYGITARPITYFYNSNGKLITKHTGGISIEILKKLIKELK